nr:hypothetical protein [Tanacetum cinerariifolium]
DLYLSEGGAMISLAITASMTGGRVNGGRTIFLSSELVMDYRPPYDPPPRGPPLRVPPLTPLGRSRMARTRCPIPECSLEKHVP